MPETAVTPTLPEYVVILGHGHSGGSWLLDILEQSAQTHCRNEPDVIPGSPFASLPRGSTPTTDLAVLEEEWDEAVRWAAMHMGKYDHHTFWGLKSYLYPLSRVTGLGETMRLRPRKLLSHLFPSLGRGEWPMPRWMGGAHAFARALPVLKISQAPTWGSWVLESRPRAQVLHIVRHPGGFLHSWRNRYLQAETTEKVRQANRDRLDAIRRRQPEWGPRFGNIDRLSLLESELWFWRYATERIHQAGEGKPRYKLIRFEELADRPLEPAREVYEACGLRWDERVAGRIARLSTESQSIAAAWASRLGPEDLDALERVLSDSPLAGWFPPLRSAQTVMGG